MTATKRALAALELVLVLPASLFMAALFVRNITPLQQEPARSAQQIVTWFTSLPVAVGLWGLLMALPLTVLMVGCAVLLHAWTTDAHFRQGLRQTATHARAHLSTLLVAAATAASAGILAVVAAHALTH